MKIIDKPGAWDHGLSVRASNCLKNYFIWKFGTQEVRREEIAKMTMQEFLALQNCGKATAAEIFKWSRGDAAELEPAQAENAGCATSAQRATRR